MYRLNLEQGRFMAPLNTKSGRRSAMGSDDDEDDGQGGNNCISINPTNQLVAVGGENGLVEVWDPRALFKPAGKHRIYIFLFRFYFLIESTVVISSVCLGCVCALLVTTSIELLCFVWVCSFPQTVFFVKNTVCVGGRVFLTFGLSILLSLLSLSSLFCLLCEL